MWRSTSALIRWMRGMFRPRPERRRVDERLDAAVAQPPQLRDRVGDAHLLVPVALAPDVAEVHERLGIEHEHVLVHQRRAEIGELDGAANGLDGRAHQRFLCLDGALELPRPTARPSATSRKPRQVKTSGATQGRSEPLPPEKKTTRT